MPVDDGLSACQALKSDERTRALPVVIMSAAPICVAPHRGAVPGRGDVSKPFDFDQLLDTVGRLICTARLLPHLGGDLTWSADYTYIGDLARQVEIPKDGILSRILRKDDQR